MLISLCIFYVLIILNHETCTSFKISTLPRSKYLKTNFFRVYSSAKTEINQDKDKFEVEEYFNNEGFNRWNKIYSESDEVNSVQLDIRNGHAITVDKVLNWISLEKNEKKTICDAGCGVGSLALPLAKKFSKVYASDISAVSKSSINSFYCL